MREHVRRRARQLALEALYESETSDHEALEVYARRVQEIAAEDPAFARRGGEPFGRTIVEGVKAYSGEADGFIAQAAPRFPVDTLPVVDRNILRLAIWELLTDTSAPVAAVVNEAVELAHRYGGESSPSFINGVLRTISMALAARRPTPAGAAAGASQPHPGE